MTQEYRQFFQVMFVVAKKDVLPWLLAIAALSGGVWYLNANKDKIKSEGKSAKISTVIPKTENPAVFNPFTSKTR